MGLRRKLVGGESPVRKERRGFWFIARDGGFTSVGVVIALTLVVALLFTTTQVYWLNSTAGDIQFAADAGALAAENVVGEYYVLARVADAVILSFSLFGMLVFGVAIVVSCIPYCQQAGVKLMEFGRKVFDVRDDCAEQAAKALDSLQKALPFLAVASAAAAIGANGFSPEGTAQYRGLAILVPLKGEDASFPDDSAAQDSADTLSEQNQETSEATDKAEEAREQMRQAKLEGYQADCGAEPNYCMYERAAHLAGLSGARNPYFSTVDLWQFDYAFERAKAYYQMRLTAEAPADSSYDEQLRSAVRRQFFAYAVEEMGRGYAHTDADGVLNAYFPLLAHNNREVRGTRLYTDRAYPVDSSGFIHGLDFCSGIEGGVIGHGSIMELEEEVYEACPICNLSVNTVGRVASASSSIENGFEYHYRIIAGAAERYEEASREYQKCLDEARNQADDALDTFSEALSALNSPRLSPHPPGRNGCVALAIDVSSHTVPGLFSSSLIGGDATLQPRIAISAAALADDQSAGIDDSGTVIGGLLEKAKQDSAQHGIAAGTFGAFDQVFDLWGEALLHYGRGVDSLTQGVGDFFRSIPLVNATPLASWAEGALQEAIEAVGLQGAKLGTPKPLLVNSVHVLRASDSVAAEAFLTAKEAYSALPGPGSGTLVSSTVDGLLMELREQGTQRLESEITLFTISFGDVPGLPQIPIKVALPPAVVEAGKGLLDDALSSVPSNLGGGGGSDVWE
jgi:tetratricopeptide (TPR) repeat protein